MLGEPEEKVRARSGFVVTLSVAVVVVGLPSFCSDVTSVSFEQPSQLKRF